MDAYRILSVCVVLFTAYIHGTYGYCKDWTNPPERPVLNLCESGETDVQPNASIYLDSEFGPTFTRIKCSCDINFNSGSGTIHLSYRTAINMDNCGVTFSLGSNVWGCKTQDLDVQAQASNNFTYLKTFEDKMNWFSCLGIRSENYGMKITCYRWEQYFLPNEVVDGVFGSWTDWSDCSVTCDDGSQTRVRLCDNPAPRNGGDECLATNGSMTLEETETRSCSQPDCTGDSVDGGFTLWTPWETCTRTCDGGTRTRTRSCTNPEPQNGGDPCSGSTNQTEECNTNDCPGSPIDGGFTDWTPWSTCSRTCDDGTRTRTRSCTNPEPQSGGEPCTGRASETEMCNTQACPVDGGWSNWSNWSVCSETCGGNGVIMRTRSCDNPKPENGGTGCVGLDSESFSCGQINCPVDGGWGTWSFWSSCPKTCGDSGYRSRSRACNDPTPQNGGSLCPGLSFETTDCTGPPCPIDGNWNPWSAWSICSKSCGGGGFQSRSRTCTNPAPQDGGAVCVGDANEAQGCGETDCPVNGGWSAWLAWSQCSQTCGAGVQARYRDCDDPVPQFGGQDCIGNDFETQDCYGNVCPVDGQWSQWSPWTSCSVTCANGTRSRYRQCNNPVPQNNGLECFGNNVENEICTENPCPVNGNWGPWSPWNQCSSTCGSGTMTRTRLCNSPSPQNGGKSCLGSNTDLEMCYVRECPINGNWGLWSPWSFCSITCGSGIISRIRECNNPEPGNEGEICQGQSTENKTCVKDSCPVDGVVGPWSPWSVCTASCGEGEWSRARFCNNPAPSNGGQNCSDILVQTGVCNIQNCLGTGAMSSSTQETPITEASTGKKKSGNLGAIIGGVLGGLCLLILIILLIICIVTRRRKRKEKQRPSSGPRSVRYVSHGDDVTVTENELYHYDGETPSHATNALFVGGIPDTPNSPGYIPHISPGNDDKYAVIMDSNRSKPNSKERPKLDSVTSQDGKADIQGVNGDVRASADTAKLAENYNEDNLGQGVENPAYDENYLAPHDSKDGETKPKTSSASSSSPYDYIDHQKLAEDDAAFENENLAGDYATLPDDTKIEDPENNDRYKRFISSDAEPSPDDGYMKSPKRDQTFEFPDKN